jgi:uncharacterized Fe-S cluster protein YjdI
MPERRRADRQGKAYHGTDVTVRFDATRCLHAAECVRGLPSVFDAKQRPWISVQGADAGEVADVVRRCPSGALHYELTGDAGEGAQRPTRVSRHPSGRIELRGDLRIDVGDGIVLEETRAALCGCGGTRNAPFCDGGCSRE